MSKKNFKGGFDALLGNEVKTSDTKLIEDTIPKSLKLNNETRATFIINSIQLEKIKAISYWERKMLKTVLYEALDQYLNKYQANKGEIRAPNP